MGKVGLVCALALLVGLSASSSRATSRAPDDGCLVVQDGFGVVTIRAKGFIFGRFLSGRVTIDDPTPGDGTVKVYGAEVNKTTILSDTKTRYVGQNMRFRASGRFVIAVNATDIDLSAAGRGSVTLSSTFDPDVAGTFSVDASSFCQDGFQPLPDFPTRLPISSEVPA